MTNQMRALLASAAEAAEMREKEAQVPAEEEAEEDKENAMEVEPVVVQVEEPQRKVGTEGRGE